MFLLGLTGGIACGKSTVAQWLETRGAIVLDADALVRELYEEPVFARRVAGLFADLSDTRNETQDILTPGGAVNREVLGRIVFADATALQRLESLVHPAVAELRRSKLRELAAGPEPPAIVVADAVKLVESGQAAGCAVVWCVVCSPETQRRRLIETRGLSAEAAETRLRNQPDTASKRELLGSTPLILIPNDGTRDELTERLEKEWKQLPVEDTSR